MPKRPRDTNQLAKLIVDISTGEVAETQVESKPNPQAEARRKGGLRGARARSQTLSPEQRASIARIAAQARWKKKP
jgi:hypothetical protein